jgi:hypothetical protein
VVSMESNTPCEHDWVLIYEHDTWSGPKRLSICADCRAFLREWLVPRPETAPRIRIPRQGADRAEIHAQPHSSTT